MPPGNNDRGQEGRVTICDKPIPKPRGAPKGTRSLGVSTTLLDLGDLAPQAKQLEAHAQTAEEARLRTRDARDRLIEITHAAQLRKLLMPARPGSHSRRELSPAGGPTSLLRPAPPSILTCVPRASRVGTFYLRSPTACVEVHACQATRLAPTVRHHRPWHDRGAGG